jgi:hypothetical protein
MAHVYNQSSSRRRFLRLIATATVCAGASRTGILRAEGELPHLTDSNPAAASLGYTEDSSTVDARKFPKHTPEQRCANCKFFQATAGTHYAPCGLYPGSAVNENGWCAGFAAR